MKKRIVIIIALIIICIFVFKTVTLGILINYDCKDFKTQQEAQKVFERYSYDKYDLDRNNNGVACEKLLK